MKLLSLSLLIAISIGGPTTVVAKEAPPKISEEDVLWVSRAVYSETKTHKEQVAIAWVLRTRKEKKGFGSTYKQIVLAKHQFSAFSHKKSREALLKLTLKTKDPDWQKCVKTCRAVLMSSKKSFSATHFYSPISMKGGAPPSWAKKKHRVFYRGDISPSRFQFFEIQ